VIARREGRYPYFAFGSNLDVRQMVRRCPGASLLGNATLQRYRLSFAGHSVTRSGGVATLVKGSRRAFTVGALYGLTREHIDALDAAEGHPWYYSRETVVVHTHGALVEAYTYILDEPSNRPSLDYTEQIARGYLAHGLDPAHLLAAVDRVVKS